MAERRGKGNVVGMSPSSQPPVEFAPWLGVFETLRVIEGVPLFVLEHMAELKRAASMLGLNAELPPRAKPLPRTSGRLRWVVTAEESLEIFSEEENAPVKPMALSVSSLRLGSHNWDARFKTVSYLTHAQALKMAATPEVILLNEHGQVASAARGNLFWRRGTRLFTPAHEAGCRCGIVRGFVLQQREVEEGCFPLDDLLAADEIFLTNSMKGIVSIDEVEGGKHDDFSCAETLRVAYDRAVAACLASREP